MIVIVLFFLGHILPAYCKRPRLLPHPLLPLFFTR